jgi:methionyl-tRNA formyltransferase
VQLDSARIIYVRTVNGPDAIHVMRTLTPDVIIQAGAGILRPRLFKLARCGTLNVHHGIAPLIRGMDSIYWGLWEKRPEWLGATVHWIDEGIDTGTVLAYAPVAACGPGEAYPALFVRATQQGVACLVETLTRLAAGEKWAVPSAGAPGVYRSTISGWKLAALALRQTFQRSGRAKATDG